MKIRNYKCLYCGNKDFFIREKKPRYVGIYCSKCRNWYKWASKSELAEIKEEKIVDGIAEQLERVGVMSLYKKLTFEERERVKAYMIKLITYRDK